MPISSLNQHLFEKKQAILTECRCSGTIVFCVMFPESFAHTKIQSAHNFVNFLTSRMQGQMAYNKIPIIIVVNAKTSLVFGLL